MAKQEQLAIQERIDAISDNGERNGVKVTSLKASCFGAEITLTNDRNQRAANLKSVLAIVSADIRSKGAWGSAIVIGGEPFGPGR